MDELFGVVVSFDLEMKQLDIYFPGGSKNRGRAYSEIRQFLVDNGYTPRKDSDYQNHEDTITNALKGFQRFSQTHKWFPLCVSKLIIMPNSLYCDYTEVIQFAVDATYKETMEQLRQEMPPE